MWTCSGCNRSFKAEKQHHFCGKIETIDQFIEEQDDKYKSILAKVREVIHAAAPEATEKISYQMPTFWQNENLIHFAPFKNHLGVYPGDLTDSPFSDRLFAYQTTKGMIQFPYDNIDYDLITDITKWRVAVAARRKK